VKTFSKRALLRASAAPAILGASLFATAASAQDAPQTAEAAATDTIVVTGSLIRNPNLTSSSPVTAVGETEMQLRQTTNAEALLRDIPSVVPSIGQNVNNGNGGAAYVNLRGLGRNRNIVLLDGQRVTPADFGGSFDLNNIPTALVSRVDVLTGGAGNDTLRGGAGNDMLDGGFTPAAAGQYKVTLSGGASVLGADGDNLTIAGVTITAAAAPAAFNAASASNQILTGADADQVGSAFAAVSLATWKTALVAAGASAAEANELLAVGYDGFTNVLTLQFSNAAAAQSLVLADFATGKDLTGGSITATEALTAAVARQESADTYVFEASAALNGLDTINNFNAAGLATDDTLDFSAFLGGAANVAGAAADFQAAGLDLSGAANAGVVFNKAVLAASDIQATAAAGKIALENNGKAVVLATADADGMADAANTGYNVYFIEDTDAGAGINYNVYLVGIRPAIRRPAARRRCSAPPGARNGAGAAAPAPRRGGTPRGAALPIGRRAGMRSDGKLDTVAAPSSTVCHKALIAQAILLLARNLLRGRHATARVREMRRDSPSVPSIGAPGRSLYCRELSQETRWTRLECSS